MKRGEASASYRTKSNFSCAQNAGFCINKAWITKPKTRACYETLILLLELGELLLERVEFNRPKIFLSSLPKKKDLPFLWTKKNMCNNNNNKSSFPIRKIEDFDENSILCSQNFTTSTLHFPQKQELIDWKPITPLLKLFNIKMCNHPEKSELLVWNPLLFWTQCYRIKFPANKTHSLKPFDEQRQEPKPSTPQSHQYQRYLENWLPFFTQKNLKKRSHIQSIIPELQCPNPSQPTKI